MDAGWLVDNDDGDGANVLHSGSEVVLRATLLEFFVGGTFRVIWEFVFFLFHLIKSS